MEEEVKEEGDEIHPSKACTQQPTSSSLSTHNSPFNYKSING
jgi:hypothetical protein